MDTAVALLQGYLQLNGYLTLAEFPVVASRGSGTEVLTDVDLIALRFPRAAALGRVGGEGRETAPGSEAPDPALAIAEDAMDLLICEVKEGRGRLNPNLRREDVLRATLLRVHRCPPEHVEHHVHSLLRHGAARMEHPGRIACRARLAVASGRQGETRGAGLVLDLGHVARYTEDFIRRRRDALAATHLTHPVLGLFHLLDKLELCLARRAPERLKV